MQRQLWRILLVSLVGSPLAFVLAQALNRWAISAQLVSSHSFMGGTLLHELPFVVMLLPLVVAITALGYVACALLLRGRIGLPAHPRAVTWLVLANFLLPIWLVAISLGRLFAS